MPIALLTGLPGNGKTYELVGHLGEIVAIEGRPVFHNGIPDLKNDWQLMPDPTKWYELPDNSVIVIDEAQRVFPVPKVGSERPRHVRELETHRHRGFDLVLATQKASLIDSHVRALCQPHIHVERVFGLQQCKRMMWETVQDAIDYHARKNAQVKVRRFRKEVYDLYCSATHHTIQRRIPFKIWALLGLLVALVVVAGVALWQFNRMRTGDAAAAARGVDPKAQPPRSATGEPYRGGLKLQTTSEFIASTIPRVPNLLHTAPRYDKLTEPRQVPRVMGCTMEFYTSAQECRCLTQQGTIADVSREFCVRYLNGERPFLDWLEPDAAPQRSARSPESNRVSLDGWSDKKEPIDPMKALGMSDPLAKPSPVAQ